ncbi:hypothetical protein V6N11_071428 [Hibiscus sabdariffa]|uniref:Uncharacterized protein n=1 Tax=Hibiscus sabdariffa TaxID=183260 RepID=A0ABR2U026_9ROSI
MRIVLNQERKKHVIKEHVPIEPATNAPRADKDKLDDMVDDNLKEISKGQARQERYKTSKALFQCKMSEESLVRAHNDELYPNVGKAGFSS